MNLLPQIAAEIQLVHFPLMFFAVGLVFLLLFFDQSVIK